MKHPIFIPSNFDAQKLIEAKLEGVVDKRGITPDNLHYICHCIIKSYLNYKQEYWNSKNFKPGFVPLSSKYLRNIITYYNQCVKFLIENDVLLCDNHYIKNEKCYGYSLTDQYIKFGFKEVEIREWTIKKQINKHAAKEDLSAIDREVALLTKKRNFLANNLLDSKFQIDLIGASEDIQKKCDSDCQDALVALNAGNENLAHAIFKQAKINSAVLRTLIERINNKTFEIIIDKTGHRLHSPITRLPSYLRKHLTFNNQSFVAIDIKNSQPYLSTILLTNPEFYSEKTKKSQFYLKKLDVELFNGLGKTKVALLTSITLHNSLETLASTEDASLINYINDVFSGQLYDQFIIGDYDNVAYKKKRDAVKKQFMTAIYDVPKNFSSTKFRKIYETPFKVFDILKSSLTGHLKKRKLSSKTNRKERAHEAHRITDVCHPIQPSPHALERPKFTSSHIDKGYAKLATLLQRIESHILLDVICTKIHELDKNIPLITIHDCVATTHPYKDLVEKIMLEIFESVIGAPPVLHFEEWS